MLSAYIDKVLTYPKTVLLLIALGTFIAFWGLTKVDVNSKFEIAPALKDVKKLSEFVKIIK